MAVRRSGKSVDLFGVGAGAEEGAGASQGATGQGTSRGRAHLRAQTQRATKEEGRGAARRRRRMSAPDEAAMLQRLAQRPQQGRGSAAKEGRGEGGEGAARHPGVAQRRDPEIGSALITSTSAGWATSLRGDAGQAASKPSRRTSTGARPRGKRGREGSGGRGEDEAVESLASAHGLSPGSDATPTLSRWDEALLAELVEGAGEEEAATAAPAPGGPGAGHA